jgi:predicted amidophosphoribosyltransferase
MLAVSRRRVPAGRCECGAPLPWGSHFCPNCGRPAGQTIVACPECEHPLPADARFCANCGAAAGAESADEDVEPGGNGSDEAEPIPAPHPVAADGSDDGAA